MTDSRTVAERDLEVIRRELRELAYTVNRILHVVEELRAGRAAPLDRQTGVLFEDHRPRKAPPSPTEVDPGGLFFKAQAETQGRTLEEEPFTMQVGRMYRRRDGAIVGPLTRCVAYTGWFVAGGWMYETGGTKVGWDKGHPHDLIAYA